MYALHAPTSPLQLVWNPDNWKRSYILNGRVAILNSQNRFWCVCKQERLVNIIVYTEVTNILPETLFTLHTSQPLPSLLPRPSDSRHSHYLSTLILSCNANLKHSVYCHGLLVSIVALRQSVGTKCSQCTSINTQSAELRVLNIIDREIFTIKRIFPSCLGGEN